MGGGKFFLVTEKCKVLIFFIIEIITSVRAQLFIKARAEVIGYISWIKSKSCMYFREVS